MPRQRPMTQRAWQLGIVWALLLVQAHAAAKRSTEEPAFTPYKGSEDKYDIVDVAQQQSNTDSHSKTGHTSRFFTTTDVDDQFWLKHLGDDFKRAIHLQVDGHQQDNGVYNMSEDGSIYQVQHEYTQHKQHPVQENYKTNSEVMENGYTTERQTMSNPTRNPATGSSEQAQENGYQVNTQLASAQQQATTEQTGRSGDSKNSTIDQNAYNKSFEQIFAIDDAGFANSIYNAKRKTQKRDRAPKAHMKYSYSHKDRATKKSKTSRKSFDKTLDTPPVVVDLPDNGKSVVQLNDNNTPVVVKMPPVIYHAKSERTQTETTPKDYTETQKHQTQEHPNTSAATPTQSQTYTTQQMNTYDQPEPAQSTNTQYADYSQQMTHNTQEHQKQFNHYTQVPTEQQHYQMPTSQQQHEQSTYQQYGASNFYAQDGGSQQPYEGSNVYQSSNNQINSEDPTQELRYILNGKQMPAYGDTKQQSTGGEIYSEYNRDSNANRELFNQGL